MFKHQPLSREHRITRFSLLTWASGDRCARFPKEDQMPGRWWSVCRPSYAPGQGQRSKFGGKPMQGELHGTVSPYKDVQVCNICGTKVHLASGEQALRQPTWRVLDKMLPVKHYTQNCSLQTSVQFNASISPDLSVTVIYWLLFRMIN